MNKTIIFAVLSMLTVIFNTCDMNFNPLNSSQNSQNFLQLVKHTECYDSLNTFLYAGNITIDKLGQAWFSTVFCDTSVEIPPWSSIACKVLWEIYKFDGIKFSIENPEDKNGSTISGTVRHIATNNADLVCVVSEETKKLSSYSSTLSVYDGSV